MMESGYIKLPAVGFPDGNEMIRINTNDFGAIARSILNDPTSTSNEIADVNQWLSKNGSYADATKNYTPTPETKSAIDYVNDIAAKLNLPAFLGGQIGSAIKTKVDPGNVIQGYVEKYGIALLAIVLGLIFIVGSIYLYKGK